MLLIRTEKIMQWSKGARFGVAPSAYYLNETSREHELMRHYPKNYPMITVPSGAQCFGQWFAEAR